MLLACPFVLGHVISVFRKCVGLHPVGLAHPAHLVPSTCSPDPAVVRYSETAMSIHLSFQSQMYFLFACPKKKLDVCVQSLEQL